jgi:VWFA-related protein
MNPALLPGQRWVFLLGWSLVHFLWQGTLIAFGFGVVRALFSRVLSPNARYALASATLAAMTMAPVLTCLVLMHSGAHIPALWPMIPRPDWQRVLPFVVMAWFGGAVACSGRLIGGWRLASRIRSTAVQQAPPEWRQAVEGLARRMGAWQSVRLLVSSLVEVPAIVGWLRPVILMPVHALTGLPPEHVTALLAHELAHIRRHDYLANILQNAAEALLFYHPAVWWVSNQIRAERELCCDDLALAACGGDVLTYARALAGVESLRPAHANAILAANGGSLSSRIRRLIGQPPTISQSLPGAEAVWSLALFWVVGIGAVTMHGSTPMPAELSIPVLRPAISGVAIDWAAPRAFIRPLQSAAVSAVLFDPLFEPVAPPLPEVAALEIPRTPGPEPPAARDVPAAPDVFAAPDAAPAAGPPQMVAPPPQPESPIRTEKRLMEVEVVVRDKNGPVKGLTKDDFTLLQEGKAQRVAVLSTRGRAGVRPRVIPAGAVSNRQDDLREPVHGSTAILIDQLHTRFDMTGYVRHGVATLLQALAGEDSPTALYTLGQNLHLLHDFTDSPQKLVEAAAQLNRRHGPVLASAFEDYGDLVIDNGAFNTADVDGHATIRALTLIAEHLSRMPGRRNLVWLMDQPEVPSPVVDLLRQANIVVYPVTLRGGPERAAEILAATTGGRAFFDAMDLPSALKLAEEDSANTYVLGYYPAEDARSGHVQYLSVKARNKSFEVRARPAYFAATRAGDELVRSSLDLTSVGLTAQVRPDPAGPGFRQMRLTVDLHDVHLEPNGDDMEGAFDLVLLTRRTPSARLLEVRLKLPRTEWERDLETGYSMNVSGIDAGSGIVRVAVRDRTTGAAGSLRIPGDEYAGVTR